MFSQWEERVEELRYALLVATVRYNLKVAQPTKRR